MLGLVKRLGALALLLGILVGFPALLVFTVGSPWPDGGLNELSMMTNSAVLGLISLLGWFVWAQLVLCTLWEIPPALRHETHGASRLPIAIGGQQRLMRMLVHTVLAVGVTSTTLLGSPAAAPAEAAPRAPLQPLTTQVAVDQSAEHVEPTPAAQLAQEAGQRNDGGPARIVTERGDTLWGLAEKHLGDGFRWQEIADLNQGRVMADGRVFTNPRHIESGWELRLPADTSNLPAHSTPGDSEGEHLVVADESLSTIAREMTGDPDNWPALYEANRDVVGSDPDLIYPGQVLDVPTGFASTPTLDTDTDAGDSAPQQRAPHQQPGTPDDQHRHVENGQPGAEGGESTPGAPETPPVTPSAPGTVENPDGQQVVAEAGESDEGGMSVLRALLASAACLSVGALGLVAANRRRQFRHRRIGRTIASTPEQLVEVEQAIIENGSQAQDDVVFLDRALRHVAASCRVTGAPLPHLGAAALGGEDLTLLFTSPASGQVPEGWTTTDDARAWMLPRWTILESDLETQPAPYPALVSIGLDESGRTWLLDLETLGMFGIAGAPQQVADLTRFLVAELAVNAWSEGSEVLLVDPFGAESLGLNPARLRQVRRKDALARAAMVAGEMDQVEQNLGADLLTRRRDGVLLDTANPVVVVVASRPDSEAVADIAVRDRSRVVVVHSAADGVEESSAVELTGDGMAFLPMWGISVRAFSLADSEAEAMAALLVSTRNLEDEPVPATQSDDGPLGKFARADGSLREEYTEPRLADGGDAFSILPEADEVYLATAATTPEDLATLAPAISEEVRGELTELDPTLDEDLADWFAESSPRPKVHLLGPVEVTALNGGDPAAIDNAKGAVAFIAYLAWLEKGVTGERAAADCGWSSTRTVQNRGTNARFLLGKRPDGSEWLPDAGMSSGALRGGTPTYELDKRSGGVLNSADLFVRLNNRARRLGSAAGGVEDLTKALALVTGCPFEGATEARFRWLIKKGHPDQILAGAIVDTANLLATWAVPEGRTDLVRLACETARKANPHANIAWLDQAAATEAESGREAASELVREHILDAYDEDLPERTERIIEQRGWGTTG